jgi:hypothetical protein
MFIERGKPEEIPKGAIRLTKEEVIEYMTDLIHKWPNTMELLVAITLHKYLLSSTILLFLDGR